jgi:PD-(D/E)XK endonuclease
MTTDQKGGTAELAIALAAIRLGVDVYRPLVEGGRYDLVFGVGPRLLRVQCKWAPLEGDVIAVRCYSCRRNRDGLMKRKYEPGEIDAFAAYCPDFETCYFLPYESFSRQAQISLRLRPARNNQLARVNWAKDFEFGATLTALGAVAQLGERRAGSA